MEHITIKKRLSVGLGLFFTCLVLTTVVGLFGGLMISNYTHDNYVLYAQRETPAVAEAVPETAGETAAAPEAEEKSQSVEAAISAGTVGTFSEGGQYTKAQVVEMCAPSVVGIDISYTATMNNFWYGYGQSYEATGSGSGVILTAQVAMYFSSSTPMGTDPPSSHRSISRAARPQNTLDKVVKKRKALWTVPFSMRFTTRIRERTVAKTMASLNTAEATMRTPPICIEAYHGSTVFSRERRIP